MKDRSARFISTILAVIFTWSTADTGLSGGLDHWSWRNPLPSGSALNSVAYGGGAFVAVGNIGAGQVSADGLSWTTLPSLGTNNLIRVLYAAGLFVIVGNKGTILTSTNGIAWTVQSSGTTNDLLGITYGNNLFAVVGRAGTFLVSTNGAKWSARNVGLTSDLSCIAFGNGIFVLPTAPGSNPYGGPIGTVLVSSDASTWSPHTVPSVSGNGIAASTVDQIVFANGEFVAFVAVYKFATGQGAYYYSSTDGITWVQGIMLPGATPTLIAANNNFFEYFQVGTNVSLEISSDGQTWMPTTFPPLNLADIAYGAGRYIGAGRAGNLATSVNGTTWSAVSAGLLNRISSLAYGPGVIVAVGSGVPNPVDAQVLGLNAPILISTNGSAFALAPIANTNQTLACVAYGAGNFVAVGVSGALQRSTNGLNWVVRPAGTSATLAGVCYGNGLWVAVGAGGVLVTSPNGLAWTLRESGTGENLFGVTCGNGQFVATGYEGTVITSPDGFNWTAQYVDSLSSLYRVVYGNGLFVAVGDAGTVAVSADGINWQVQVTGTSLPLLGVDFGAGQFVAVAASVDGYDDGEDGTAVLLKSYNGSNWQTVPTPTDWDLAGVSFINQTFYICGGNGSILQSDPLSPQPVILGQMMPNNTGYQLAIDGMDGQTFRIQMRTNLNTGTWSDLTTITNAKPLQTWTDTTAPGTPRRFYRIISP